MRRKLLLGDTDFIFLGVGEGDGQREGRFKLRVDDGMFLISFVSYEGEEEDEVEDVSKVAP